MVAPSGSVKSNFLIAEFKLSKLGFKVVNPLKLKPAYDYYSWAGYMGTDVYRLAKYANYIFYVDDYLDSDGKNVEMAIAECRGIDRVYFSGDKVVAKGKDSKDGIILM